MSGALLTSVAVLLTVLALAPRGRSPRCGPAASDSGGTHASSAWAAGDGRTRAGPGLRRGGGTVPGGAPARRWTWGRGHAGRTAPDLVRILHDAAARVRGGSTPAAAWSGALGRSGVGSVPTVGDVLGGARCTPRQEGRAAAAVAASRLAADLGMPLADVLEHVARAVAADEEHEAEVEAALAGPRATARVLVALPAAGLLLGTLLGADPVGTVVAGGAGTLSAAAGALLLLAGWWWTRALLARTASAGTTT